MAKDEKIKELERRQKIIVSAIERIYEIWLGADYSAIEFSEKIYKKEETNERSK